MIRTGNFASLRKLTEGFGIAMQERISGSPRDLHDVKLIRKNSGAANNVVAYGAAIHNQQS